MNELQKSSCFSTEVELALAPYRAEYQQIVNGWLADGTFGATYPALLVETFHYVKHSCSLMNRACAHLGNDRSDLQCYLAQHIAEEVGHENWVLNDLEELGYKRESVVSSPPLPETLNLIGSQLYVIDFCHPAGLLGYIYVMESQAPTEESLLMIQESYEIEPTAMSFLIRHGEADVQHKRELVNALDKWLNHPTEQEAALTSALMGAANVNRLLSRLRSGDYRSCLPEFHAELTNPLVSMLPSHAMRARETA